MIIGRPPAAKQAKFYLHQGNKSKGGRRKITRPANNKETKSVPCRVESIGQTMQESTTTQLANTESPIIDLGIIIDNHQAAASSKASEIIIALTALIKAHRRNHH
jgi:hypothetical protein